MILRNSLIEKEGNTIIPMIKTTSGIKNMKKSVCNIKINLCAVIVAAISVILPTTAMAQSDSGYLMTQAEKEAVQNVVKEYISENGDFLLEVLQSATQKKVQEEVKADSVIENPPEGLYNAEHSPVIGNPNADVTVVEFFDYNCGYCKRVAGDVQRLVEEDKNVRVVFKEFPILSESSQVAARYALAAAKQGKYNELHMALMKQSGRVDEKEILRVADSLQIDIRQLNEDVYSTDIGDELTANSEMAREIGVRGTPFFVVNGEKYPGALSYARLKALVESARIKAKKEPATAPSGE